MSSMPQYDPLSTEILSTFLAGMSEGLNKLSTALNCTTSAVTDAAMSEVYIGTDDRYRIYQVAAGNRLWLSDPAPVIKKNGSVITPVADNFTIDYVGGAIIFESGSILTESDVVTVSVTRISNASQNIETLQSDVAYLQSITSHFIGYYSSYSNLVAAKPVGTNGDFSIIGGSVDSIYMWDSTDSEWKDICNEIPNEKLALMANNTIKGNVSGSAAAPYDLTVAQVRGIITEGTSVVDAIADGDKLIIEDVSASAGSRTKHVLWSAIKTALAGASSGIEATANKVTSISAASTDTQYPSAKCTYDAIASQRAEKYTAVWDKVNAQCTRADSASGISTTITNFCHRGTVNASLSNPFNSIYPWSGRGVCNIDVVAYRALSAGDSLLECIVAWLGDPDFDYNHANGVWVYTPEFWYAVQDIGASRYFSISPTAIAGYIHAPEAIEGRWHGGAYTLTIDGVSKTCLLSKPGMPGKNVAMSTLHTYAKNWGASVENIYGYSATDVLMIVEFATMNTQTAIGNGVSDLYRQGSYTIKANATASATVKILTADASTHCIPGAIFDIGATDGSAGVGSFIITSTALDSDPTYTIVTLTTDGSTPASITVTTAHFWSVHGLSNTVDASIGAGSGYIGTNGKSHAYYRGQLAHANIYRYILGAYRETGTGKIWIANNPTEADAYDALNTAVHKDTGFALPQGAAGAAAEGYINALRLCPDVPAAPFCETIGGSSANPIGDYCYVPTLATANTILFAGGTAYYGTSCGRFFGAWSASAANSYWYIGALPVLKTP